jgi:hypothetical protein
MDCRQTDEGGAAFEHVTPGERTHITILSVLWFAENCFDVLKPLEAVKYITGNSSLPALSTVLCRPVLGNDYVPGCGCSSA